ncbi:MAG: type III-B CRISPR module RAMP protein Cmr4 [Chloroflexota bacterium]|nr:type III-B CRISPR module RAMP protein Cmr4 [Dehalococcoidia bacterium]MDW8253850.1 type III-B CRISPR module RAMP protein Cmr4 [Chloroflexota bacterium]
MIVRPFLVHALSPLHAGVGHAADVVDLPIARLKATGIPFIPGSSLKGVLRDARQNANTEDNNNEERLKAVFGPPTGEAHEHASALSLTDARLLAMPVRSFRGVFAWTTSPLLLKLAKRDLNERARDLPVPAIDGRRALVTSGSAVLHKNHVYLGELDLEAAASPEAARWAQFLAPWISPEEDIFSKRFVIVDDDTMAFFMETATQVDARVRLDDTTRTVAQGALWLEESLPPETVLIGLLVADRSRRNGKLGPLSPEEVADFALPREETLQIGGKATTGHGRCRIIPVS